MISSSGAASPFDGQVLHLSVLVLQQFEYHAHHLALRLVVQLDAVLLQLHHQVVGRHEAQVLVRGRHLKRRQWIVCEANPSLTVHTTGNKKINKELSRNCFLHSATCGRCHQAQVIAAEGKRSERHQTATTELLRSSPMSQLSYRDRFAPLNLSFLQ